MSIERPCVRPLRVDDLTTRADIEREFRGRQFRLDLDRLWNACPFRAGA